MQDWGTKREKYSYHNYLTSLVKSLENQHTVIDLRNESYVSGLIKHVDGLMNVDMENVLFCDSRGQEHNFENFYISARNIRYVHIPPDLSSIELIKNQLEMMKPQQRPPKKDNFKTKRARQYHAEIISELREPQPGSSQS